MKYTKEQRLDIGRRIYNDEITKYEAAEQYGMRALEAVIFVASAITPISAGSESLRKYPMLPSQMSLSNYRESSICMASAFSLYICLFTLFRWASCRDYSI